MEHRRRADSMGSAPLVHRRGPKYNSPGYFGGIFAMRIVISILLLLLALPTASRAGWPTDPSVNLPVSLAHDDQIHVRIVDDGNGGALLGWMDHRQGTWDLFGARVRLDASQPWPFYGRSVADSSGNENALVMDSDGTGGAVLAWNFGPNSGSVYAQRINNLGDRLWGLRGILIATNASESQPLVVHDGAAGAIVIWSTCKFCSSAQIRAQRIGANG